MTSRPVLEPTAEHPITINPTGARVVVRVNGEVVADTHQALQLQESTYPAVQYIPFKDVGKTDSPAPTPAPTAHTRARPATTA